MAGVSRETDVPDRPLLEHWFGDRASLFVRYADWLATAGVDRGLIGPREPPRLWARHLLNCAAFAPQLPPDCTLCDVGSGAGLPGLVLALARSDVQVTLLEPLLRRATFLSEVVADLALENVAVERGRAEELAGRALFDIVTARAVAPLDVLVRWAMPLVRVGGELVAYKGEGAAEEVAAADAALRKVAPRSVSIEIHSLGMEAPSATVVRIVSSRTYRSREKGPR